MVQRALSEIEKFEIIASSQRGRKKGGHGKETENTEPFVGRRQMISRFVSAHIADAKRSNRKPIVTIAMVAEMLDGLDRGYSLGADQISRSLSGFYKSEKLERYSSNSRRVSVDGQVYRSIRQAALVKEKAIRTVTNRIQSKNPKFSGWKYTDG